MMTDPHAARRICFVITSSDFGGAESLLLRTVTALDRSRYTCLVISLKPVGAVGHQIAAAGIRVESLNYDARS